MILSSTSPYALLKEFSIACGFRYDAVFRVCLNNFCERLQSLHEKSFIVPVLTGRPKISTFGTFAEKHFLATFRICAKINVQDCRL